MRNSKRGAIPDDLAQIIDDLDDIFLRLKKIESPSGSDAASTLGLTMQNVAELQARTTTSNEAIYNATLDISTPIPWASPALAPVEFTIAQRRKVYVRTSCFVSMLIVNDGSGSVFADPYALVNISVTMMNLDLETSTLLSTPLVEGSGYIAGSRTMGRSAQRAFLDDYQILNPGNYRAVFSCSIATMTGTLGTISFQNPRLAVEVMERA